MAPWDLLVGWPTRDPKDLLEGFFEGLEYLGMLTDRDKLDWRDGYGILPSSIDRKKRKNYGVKEKRVGKRGGEGGGGTRN